MVSKIVQCEALALASMHLGISFLDPIPMFPKAKLGNAKAKTQTQTPHANSPLVHVRIAAYILSNMHPAAK